MCEKPPVDPADHAEDLARRWRDKLDEYCTIRMDELGIPEGKNREEDPNRPKTWHAFVTEGRTGGFTSRGITVNSGCLKPDLLKGEKGGRVWAKARLRDRIDAIITHEWVEDQLGDHNLALNAARKTELPVSDGARRILKAMGR